MESDVMDNLEYRIEQYSICKVRGHQSTQCYGTWGRTEYTCKYCGVKYWTEQINHESNVPVKESS